jgi:hypothetical protein
MDRKHGIIFRQDSYYDLFFFFGMASVLDSGLRFFGTCMDFILSASSGEAPSSILRLSKTATSLACLFLSHSVHSRHSLFSSSDNSSQRSLRILLIFFCVVVARNSIREYKCCSCNNTIPSTESVLTLFFRSSSSSDALTSFRVLIQSE